MTEREIFDSPDETFSYCLAILTLLCLVAAPIGFVFMTRNYLKELKKEKEEEQKISSEAKEVFKDYRVHCTAVFYPFVFF